MWTDPLIPFAIICPLKRNINLLKVQLRERGKYNPNKCNFCGTYDTGLISFHFRKLKTNN